MDYAELIAFILYFLIVLGIGLFFFFKSKGTGEKDYFLGGRQIGPWVTAMSAQASDMSGWLLMGFPGSILAFGFGKVWIGIGLMLGTYLNWLLTARRLRRFSAAAKDSITIPQYLTNRFQATNPALRLVCAIVFMVCFTIYVASGFKAGGNLFSTVMGIDGDIAMIIFACIIIAYTFTGGFKAVCWTDFFQGILMLVAILLVPIIIFATKDVDLAGIADGQSNYFNLLPSGKFDWESISSILSGLAWGLGYFGMPHIIIRFMAIKNSKMIKTSRRIATVWVVITLSTAVIIAMLGRALMPELVSGGSEMVFIKLVRDLFPSFIAGILLSAILAASMSTADSQLLVASSSLVSDIYKPIFRKKASDKEILWAGRVVVLIIAVIAFFIARNPSSGGIMDLVENAWAGFGSAFGPVILLSLFWRRFTYVGALSGIVLGGLTDVIWKLYLTASTGLYELLPGFLVCLIACVIGSLLTGKEGQRKAMEIFDKATDPNFNED